MKVYEANFCNKNLMSLLIFLDNVEFQPHSFESPLGSVLGTIVGIAFLLVVSAVVIGIWVKQQKQKRLYAKDDHEVAFLTQNAEDEPILDFSLASPSRD